MASLQADALRLPITDHTVDLIVTSPPYFGLRSYANGGIGEEPTPAEYVDALIAATREMIRVLKPSGSIFLNLGDKYVADNRGSSGDAKRGAAKYAPTGPAGYAGEGVMPRKSLMLLPARYAIRCVDELGLILRRDLIWDKPNGLPESVTDRCRSSHEYWFHMVTQPRYYAAIDEIRDGYAPSTMSRNKYARPSNGHPSGEHGGPLKSDRGVMDANPLGKLPGSVWTIPTEPLHLPDELGVEHYAAFPSEWPRRLILGWSPREVCTACGEGRRPIVHRATLGKDNSYHHGVRGTANKDVWKAMKDADPDRIVGYACACWFGTYRWTSPNCISHYVIKSKCATCSNGPHPLPPTTPGIVLDVFGGTGTTAAVAQTLGRIGISVDIAYEYGRAANWRANDPGLRAKVLGVDKPAPVLAGQGDLF
jgi:DNA modification methylase